MTAEASSASDEADAEPATLGLLEVVGCGIWIYDGVDTRYVNRALEDITGYSRAELLQPNFFRNLIHADDVDMIVARGQARVRGEAVPEQYEIRITHRDGGMRTLALHARRLELGATAVSVVSAVDITALRTAQDTIERGSAQVIALLHSLPAHVIATDDAGKPVFLNRHWYEFTGQSREEAMQHGTAPLIHPDDFGTAARAWTRAKATGTGYQIEYRVRDRTGEYRWQNFRIEPIKDADGTLRGWTSAAVDVHEARELRLQLERANADLAEAVQTKDEVLGLISHELRTPLTTLLGNTRLLRRRIDQLSPQDRDQLATDMENDALRLNTVIENMLVLSRAGAGTELELEPARLSLLAASTIAEFQLRSPERDVHLEVQPELPLVEVNPTYYRQVLTNLLTNADKYSPAPKTIDVRLCEQDGAIVTSVADHGNGIDPEELGRVFDAFFRSRNHRGTYGIGLGLTVCQRLVELQGGAISVRNLPEGGCEFAFTVPRCVVPDFD